MSDIVTDDRLTTSDIHVLGNKSLVSRTLFGFKHTRSEENANYDDYPSYNSDASIFPPLHEKKSHQEHVFYKLSTQAKDVTPSNVMEMKTDVTQQIKMTTC